MKQLNGTAKFWAAVASVCVTILLAGFWVINTVGGISKEVAVLTERVDNAITVIEKDKEKEQRWIENEFIVLKSRITVLESK